MSERIIEHVVDCETGQGEDRDYEGDIAALRPDPAITASAKRREEALARLRAAGDPVVADLLTVLGLEGT